MPPKRPCDTCIEARDHPHYRAPQHLVHPVTNTPMLFDVQGCAICKHCGAVWHRARNDVVLLGLARPPFRAAKIVDK